jgi:hypothetical protein
MHGQSAACRLAALDQRRRDVIYTYETWAPQRENMRGQNLWLNRLTLAFFTFVAALAIIFWFTWQSIQNGSTGTNGAPWSYSQLITRAGTGQVRSVDIKGCAATATAKDGIRHNVQLAASPSAAVQALMKDGVTVSYQASGAVSGQDRCQSR